MLKLMDTRNHSFNFLQVIIAGIVSVEHVAQRRNWFARARAQHIFSLRRRPLR